MNAGTRADINFFSIYGEHGHQIDGMDLGSVNGENYASPLKISHSQAVVGANLLVAQGLENAVDVNVCDGVHLSGVFGLGLTSGDQVITVKGGTVNFSIEGKIHSRGKRGYEVGIGNWSDQSYSLSSSGLIDIEHVDGKPVRVAIGWAKPFSIKLGGHCKYMVYESLKLKAYFVLKYIARFLVRIPIGTRGPSWL